MPFDLDGGYRIDDTPVHKAIREALAIGKRAGSGVPNIMQTWNAEDWITPEIDEQFNPDRTIIKLSFIKKAEVTTQVTTQATQESTDGVQTVYTLLEIELSIVGLIKRNPEISQKTIADEIGINYNTVKYYVTKLKKMNVITRVGSSQKGRWVIKI